MQQGTLDTTAYADVLVLTIRRGAKRNAITQHLAEEIDRALLDFDRDPALRVAILTGEAPCFSAGTDLSSNTGPRTPDGGEYGFVRRKRRKPLIAAVEGWALGGGMEMALACDLVVAARDAEFGLPEVRRGVVANCGALFRATDRLPPNVAAQLLLTGEAISAERAHQVGFVNMLCEPGQAVSAARNLAEQIALGSPAAVAITLNAITATRDESEPTEWARTEAASAAIASSPDKVEGIAAFFERREPQWHPLTDRIST